MKIRAYAKINLGLDVVSKRDDGYHELDTIMVPIEMHDLIYIDRIDKGIEITANTYRMPTNQKNIMYQAAQLLIDRYHIPYGVKIHIYKHIPTQAGLAGGSADGAAVLKAMNQMFRLQLSYDTLAKIAKELGADVPFCIYEKAALVRGIGENLEFIDNHFQGYLLLVKPKKGVSTKRAFGKLDLTQAEHPDILKIKQGLEDNELSLITDNMKNTLEKPSMAIVEDIAKIKHEMQELGFPGVLMSGSGSCVFGITEDKEQWEQGYHYFRKKYNFVKKTRILKK